MLSEIPDDFVPRNNDEFVRVYKHFVAYMVRKYNKVDTNFDDLLQHVWMKLIEVRLLEKYEQSGSTPDQMTALQAAAYCQVSWEQWKVCILKGQKGVLRTKGDPNSRQTISWMPKPLEGSWCSKRAIWRTEDVEMIMSSGYFKKTHSIDYVAPKVRTKFKPYLARAIHNIWSNWCRTRSRKYKEQYLAPLEDGTSWESMQVDPMACRQESMAELSRVIDKLDKSSGGGNRNQIAEDLVSGQSVSEIVKKLSLPKSAARTVG